MNNLLHSKKISKNKTRNLIHKINTLVLYKKKTRKFTSVEIPNTSRLEKITSAVRETGVSRHNGGPIKSPP